MCVYVFLESLETDFDVFALLADYDDRPRWSDGGTDGQRSGRRPQPNLPQGRKAEALHQAEEVKRFRRGVYRCCWTLKDKIHIFFCLETVDLRSQMGSDLLMRQRLSCKVAPTNTVPVIVLEIVTFESSVILHQLRALS